MGFTKLTDKNGFEKETKVSKKGEKKWKITIQ